MGRGASQRAAQGQAAAGSSPPVVFASELLLWVASALRLSVIRTGDEVTSEATAKRAATGSARVSGERVREMAHASVRALFEGPYLAALGLDPVEAELLTVQMTAVLEWFLERWDVLATGANHNGPAFLLFAGQDLALDVALRLAALCVRHALRHLDLLACAPYWTGNGVSDALKAMQSSCVRPPSERAICEKTGIAKNTLKALRNGKSLPQEESVLRLAVALSDLGARGPRGSLSEAEIRFSLRVACLATEARRDAPWSDATGQTLASFRWWFSVCLEVLGELPDRALNDLVAHGRSSKLWPAISAAFRVVCAHTLFTHLSALEQRHMMAMPAPGDPPPGKDLQWLASHAETIASLARLPPGFPEMNPFQVLTEDMAAFLRSIVEGQPPPPWRQEPAELESFFQYMDALDPWREFAPGEREGILQSSVEACPTSANAQVRFALAIDDGGKHRASALQALKEACRLDPEHATARSRLAVLLFEDERYEEALAEATRHLEHHPQDMLTRGVQGSALLRLGQPEQALATVDEALRYKPRLSWLFDLHARCLRALGDEKGARESDRQARLCSAGSLRQPDTGPARGRRPLKRKRSSAL